MLSVEPPSAFTLPPPPPGPQPPLPGPDPPPPHNIKAHLIPWAGGQADRQAELTGFSSQTGYVGPWVVPIRTSEREGLILKIVPGLMLR